MRFTVQYHTYALESNHRARPPRNLLIDLQRCTWYLTMGKATLKKKCANWRETQINSLSLYQTHTHAGARYLTISNRVWKWITNIYTFVYCLIFYRTNSHFRKLDIFLPLHKRFLITGPLFVKKEEQVQIPKRRAPFLTRWYEESRNQAIIKLSWINLQVSYKQNLMSYQLI
jgi:hypothetical protein